MTEVTIFTLRGRFPVDECSKDIFTPWLATFVTECPADINIRLAVVRALAFGKPLDERRGRWELLDTQQLEQSIGFVEGAVVAALHAVATMGWVSAIEVAGDAKSIRFSVEVPGGNSA